MTTIFDQIESAVSGGDFESLLGGQVTSLGQVQSTVAGLVEHPPSGIDDLLGSVKTLPLPNVGLGDLPSSFASLKSALPSDLGSVTGGVTGPLDSLGGDVSDSLSKALTAGVGPVLALRKLLELDFSAFHAPDPSHADPPPAAPAGPQRAAQALDAAQSALSSLPASFTTEDVLKLLASGLADATSVPLLADLAAGLQTLLTWSAQAPADIVSSLSATLDGLEAFVTESIDAAFGTLAADATAAATALAPLDAIAGALLTHLTALKAAPGSSAELAALNAALDQLQAFTLPAQLPVIQSRLAQLPQELDAQLGHVVTALAPPGAPPINLPDPLPPLAQSVIDAIDGAVSPAIAWLQDIAAKLDLTALSGPIQTASDAVNDAVGTVEHGLAAVTTEVQQLFSQLESLLDQVDPTAITGAITDALQAFSTAISTQLTQLFAPVKDLLSGAISELDTAVQAFDPASIVDALKQLVDDLAGVLDDPAIKQARDTITAAFTSAENGLKTLSFEPVTGEVVKAIDTITDALKALDPSLLSTAMQAALMAAKAALPPDLKPVTDPLLADFQQLVDTGPGKLVDEVRAPVKQLQDQIKQFEPTKLVGTQLDQPFQDAVSKLEAFKPSALLKPVEDELAKLKDRITQAIGPQKLLAPLEAPFDELLQGFDQLKPDALVQPLQDAIDGVVNKILGALPIDDLLGPVESVLDTVQAVNDVLTKGKDVFTGITAVLDQLGDAPAEVEAFVAGVLDKLGDASALQPKLDALAAALDATTAAALQTRATSVVQPLLASATQLPEIALAQRAIDASGQPALQAALDRANPLGDLISRSLGTVGAFQRDVQSAQTALTAELTDWDARYHAPDGVLAQTAALQAANLKQWLHDAAAPQVIAPLRVLLAPAGPVKAALAPIITQLGNLLTDLAGKLATFGTGPGSIGSIATAIDGLLDRLRHVDLGFLKDGLAQVFADVRAKLVAISPAALAAPLQQVFDAALSALDLSSLLPQPELDQLDADVQKIVDALKGLEPSKLITDAVQPEYDSKVAPLIDAFDFSGVLDALLQALHGLHDELQKELGDVNTAYEAMLAAVPSIDPTAVAGDVADAVGSLF